MDDIKLGIGLAILLAIGAMVWAVDHRGYQRGVLETDSKWNKVENERKAKAQAKLDAATDRYVAAEAANAELTASWEQKDNEQQDYIHGLRIANGRLITAAGGLFDRNGRPTGRGGGNAPGAAAGAELVVVGGATGCRLSDELSEFLQSRFEDADNAARLAQRGHDLAVEIDVWRKAHAGGLPTGPPH